MSIAGKYKLLGTAVLTATLGLPAAVALAESTTNTSVAVRDDAAMSRDLGREGSDVYLRQREPTAPPAPVVKAYDASKEFVVDKYNEAKAVVTQPPKQEGPERFGRAGGYVGVDVLHSPLWSKSAAGSGEADTPAQWYGRAGVPSSANGIGG